MWRAGLAEVILGYIPTLYEYAEKERGREGGRERDKQIDRQGDRDNNEDNYCVNELLIQLL